MRLWIFITAGITGTMLFSCKKDASNNSGNPNSDTSLLSQAPWKYASSELKYWDSTSWQPDTGYVDYCQKDDILTFNSNGTGNNNAGSITCNPILGDANNLSFTWSFGNSNATLLILNSTLGTNRDSIILTKDTLQLLGFDSSYSTTPHTLTQYREILIH